ncbi:MAG: hypothetical protein ACLP2Y_03890 [Limisphaerales bacterium]
MKPTEFNFSRQSVPDTELLACRLWEYARESATMCGLMAIASLSGAADDPRHFQISVPVQPGNSGGALVDGRGDPCVGKDLRFESAVLLVFLRQDESLDSLFWLESAEAGSMMPLNPIMGQANACIAKAPLN